MLKSQLRFTIRIARTHRKHRVYVTFGTTVDPSSKIFAEVIRRVDAWALVARLGGFSGTALQYERRTAKRQGPAAGMEKDLAFTLEVAALEPGAWRVLCGVLANAFATYGTAAELSLKGEYVPEEDLLIDDEIATVLYPEAPTDLPFKKNSLEGASIHSDRLVRVSFRRPVTAAEATIIEEALIAWATLLNGGFFQNSRAIGDSVADVAKPYLVAPNCFESPIPSFLGDEAAFDTVITMIASLHYQVCPVDTVELR